MMNAKRLRVYFHGGVILAALTANVSSAGPSILHGILPQGVCRPLSDTPYYSTVARYLKLDGSGAISNSATVTAAVGSSFTAVNPNGAGLSFTSGNIADGIKFGYDDYLQGGAHTGVSTSYTVSFWMKPGSAAYSLTLYHRGDSQDCFYNPRINYDGSTSILEFKESGCSNTGLVASPTISATKWTHVAMTRNGSTVKVYVNGVLRATDTSQPSPNATTGGRITLGGSWDSLTSYGHLGDPTIDELGVWNVPLTDSDIAKIYYAQICRQ